MDSVSSVSSVCGTEEDSIKIFLRVRPPDPGISENDFAPRVLDVNTSDNAIILHSKPEPKIFTYDTVADADITQEAVFSIVGKKIIESCIAGYNGTIFAYGQTGSGKTFTMLGPSENSESFQHELRGVIPRSFEYLFSLINQQQELHGTQKEFLCRCSFLEIYQEQIFDLLDPTSQGLHLRENMNKGVFVDGLIEQAICSPSDAYKVLIMGWLNRRVAATSMNRESSRSHAVFTVTIQSKEDREGVKNIRTSQLNLVDLAGSERQKDTNTGGTRLKEAGSINKSLSVLGNVIMSLVDISHGKKRHIPYRDSKLTFLLRDSLGGNTKTRMVACVHPDSKCFGETLSTLNFARSAKLIKNKAVVNEDFHGNNQKLQNEIRRLRELLEAFQNAATSPSKSLALPIAQRETDSTWKQHFVEAMYFREQSELEKKALQDVVNHLQELCNKKDKYIQSTKMIIKFRENRIESLQRENPEITELERNALVQSLHEEIKVLQSQVENNPLLAKFSGENKRLRNELKQMRDRMNLESTLSDSSRITELEKIFTELKLYKEIGNSRGPVTSASKDNLTTVLEEKHRKEVKQYQEQVETLRQQVVDVAKTWENKQMETEVELVSCKKMVAELERVLEAHQLKARIECNALKDLHCQTLKVMTTPKLSGKGESAPNTPVYEQQQCEDHNISSTLLPKDLAEGAHDALMEEIGFLQQENGKLKEKLDEFEAEELRQKQQVEKLQLHNDQLFAALEKERAENAGRKKDYASAVNTLNEEIETVKSDLKLLNGENTDLHLVLKSADKQVKEERDKHKMIQQNLRAEVQSLETKLSRTNLDLEGTTKEYEDALKELGSLKEEVETTRMTIAFLENHSKELSEARNQEARLREKLEHELMTLQNTGELNSLQEEYKMYRDKSQMSIEQLQQELDKSLCLQREQEEAIVENKRIIGNLMTSMNNLKCSLKLAESSSNEYKLESETLTREVEEVKRDLESTLTELMSKRQELGAFTSAMETRLRTKDFEICNLEETQESLNTFVQNLQLSKADLERQLSVKDSYIKGLDETIKNMKSKITEVEKSKQDAIYRYEQRIQEANMEENSMSFKKKVNQKNDEIEQLMQNNEKLKSALENYEQTRLKKNEENEKLKIHISQMEKQKEELLTYQSKYEECESNLNSCKAEMQERIKFYESAIKSKDDELRCLQASSKASEAYVESTKKELKALKEKFISKENEEQMKNEIARLQKSLSAQFDESWNLHNSMEILKEEKAKLEYELKAQKDLNANLSEENTRLAGHTNHKQKIRLMDKKNQEYSDLVMKFQKVARENDQLKEQLNFHNQSAGTSQGVKDITNVSMRHHCDKLSLN